MDADETPFDHLQARINNALFIAKGHGQIQGTQRRLWVIDQMVRALTGCEEGEPETEEYRRFIAEHNQGEDGPETYEWNTGIAP
jgi:hypothetical protein